VSSCRTQSCTSRPRHISTVPPPHTEPAHGCSRIRETATVETVYIISDTTYPKKEPMSPPRIRHYRLTHSPKHPGTDAGEDPHHQKPRKCTVEYVHKYLFPPLDEAEHDTPITHRLIGAYHYEGTMSHICSPFPSLVSSCQSPFKFTQGPCFFFLR
jgi:hypothetical protein